MFGIVGIEPTIPPDLELKMGITDNAVSQVLSATTVEDKLDRLVIAM
ncbi:MAG: hypothetical protein K2X55_26160 [Burkholderiaceae bacterium]|nr:hypothetical protein [Burkholderiaceae bacterium]